MTPNAFWCTTPRKFTALCEVHAELNDPDANKKNKRNREQLVYCDQLPFM